MTHDASDDQQVLHRGQRGECVSPELLQHESIVDHSREEEHEEEHKNTGDRTSRQRERLLWRDSTHTTRKMKTPTQNPEAKLEAQA